MTDGQTELRRPWRRVALALAASALGLSGAADARTVAPMVDMAVVDRETGEEQRVWRRGGRMFVAGRPGARYGVRVTNNTPGRVLTGETAGYDQRGYVFGPYETHVVNGWRKSDAQVAAFHFTRLSRSYAARTGRPGDVGVIGVAAFRERAAPVVQSAPPYVSPARPYAENDAAAESAVTGRAAGAAAPPPVAAAPTARGGDMAAQRRSERLGTGHGAREWSYATSVPFERATRHPQQVLRMEYDSYENLVAAGVIPRHWGGDARPRPFPGEGYVPDPPGDY